jgi:hypothetical protein
MGFYCEQCGKLMTPVEAMINPVCGSCVKKNHKRVVGGR